MTRLLCKGALAPLAMAWGFIGSSVSNVAEALVRKAAVVGTKPMRQSLRTTLCGALPMLEPVGPTSSAFLLLGHRSWTACFDNHVAGGQPELVVPLICEELGVRGLVVASIPERAGPARARSFGQIRFELYHGMECVRALALTNDGQKWARDEVGVKQACEGDLSLSDWVSATGELDDGPLETLCAEIGIALFDERAYGPDCEIVRANARGMKLRDVRRSGGWES